MKELDLFHTDRRDLQKKVFLYSMFKNRKLKLEYKNQIHRPTWNFFFLNEGYREIMSSYYFV